MNSKDTFCISLTSIDHASQLTHCAAGCELHWHNAKLLTPELKFTQQSHNVGGIKPLVPYVKG
jgi:hypothetical protein